jgi:hypothetical protein
MNKASNSVRPNSIRFPVTPRDIPPEKIARRLGLTPSRFDELKERLFARSFPRPDATTGNYDLQAVDAWMDARSGLNGANDLTAELKPRDASDVFNARRGCHGAR